MPEISALPSAPVSVGVPAASVPAGAEAGVSFLNMLTGMVIPSGAPAGSAAMPAPASDDRSCGVRPLPTRGRGFLGLGGCSPSTCGRGSGGGGSPRDCGASAPLTQPLPPCRGERGHFRPLTCACRRRGPTRVVCESARYRTCAGCGECSRDGSEPACIADPACRVQRHTAERWSGRRSARACRLERRSAPVVAGSGWRRASDVQRCRTAGDRQAGSGRAGAAGAGCRQRAVVAGSRQRRSGICYDRCTGRAAGASGSGWVASTRHRRPAAASAGPSTRLSDRPGDGLARLRRRGDASAGDAP